MKTDLSTAFATSSQDNRAERAACIFNAERVLNCGSVVSERNGRIIHKTSVMPGASA